MKVLHNLLFRRGIEKNLMLKSDKCLILDSGTFTTKPKTIVNGHQGAKYTYQQIKHSINRAITISHKRCPLQLLSLESSYSWGVSNLEGVSIPIIQQRPEINIISNVIAWNIIKQIMHIPKIIKGSFARYTKKCSSNHKSDFDFSCLKFTK